MDLRESGLKISSVHPRYRVDSGHLCSCFFFLIYILEAVVMAANIFWFNLVIIFAQVGQCGAALPMLAPPDTHFRPCKGKIDIILLVHTYSMDLVLCSNRGALLVHNLAVLSAPDSQ